MKNKLNSENIDEETLKSVPLEIIQKLEITIVLGTWCSDSQQEIPRFIKITDHVDFQSDKLTIISIDRNKEAGKISVAEMNIEFVPTIIFYLNKKEIGRIIETPFESLEKDLLKIIS